MARQSKRRKFVNNQPVVFRFGERKLIGKVIFSRPVGKKFTYDVLCEDTKVYSELQVDVAMNQCIDTYLTKLFYKKYKIDENFIPEIENSVPILNTKSALDSLIESATTEEVITEEEPETPLFEDDEVDPNY
jgi:hypothetical protein